MKTTVKIEPNKVNEKYSFSGVPVISISRHSGAGQVELLVPRSSHLEAKMVTIWIKLEDLVKAVRVVTEAP